MIEIIPYHPSYQPGIDQMMRGIQSEFSEAITTRHSTVIRDVYQLPDQKYWLAIFNGQPVGTIGMVLYANNSAVVKRMMVARDFRGKIHQTARLLLETGFDWAKSNGAKDIYLGTMEQFKAAQAFYVKMGFKPILKSALPADYASNPMDTLFYHLTIA